VRDNATASGEENAGARACWRPGATRESGAEKRESGEAAKSVSSSDEGKAAGRQKPKRGAVPGVRKRGRQSTRTLGELEALKAMKAPPRILDARVGSAHGRYRHGYRRPLGETHRGHGDQR